MKVKKILDPLLLIIIMTIIYYCYYRVMVRFGLTHLPFFYYVPAGILFFTILGLTFNKLWHFTTIKKNPTLSVILAIVFIYFLTTPVRILYDTYAVFENIQKGEGKYFEGQVFTGDLELGHKPIPCSTGLLQFIYKNKLVHKIPMKHDSKGFRIPFYDSCNSKTDKPLILFLGCSFTEGADCNAEQTFSYLVGNNLHMKSINAGVSSYGFNQMILLARKLIPEYKPDYVVVQYSPWLSERARDRFAPTKGLKIPSPYYSDVHDSIKLLPPCYPTSSFSINWKPDQSKSSLYNYLSFLFQEGLLVVTKDYWNAFKSEIMTNSPAKNNQVVEETFFKETMAIAKENNSKLIVLNLGDIEYTHKSHDLLDKYQVNFAEADSLLWTNVKFDQKEFNRNYYFSGWTGKDTIVIDRHPTVNAHAIIANSIITAIHNYK